MTNDRGFDEIKSRASSRIEVFETCETTDFVNSPRLIEVLRASALEADASTIQLGRTADHLRKERDALTATLSRKMVAHERELAQTRERLARMDVNNQALKEHVRELEHQSRIAIIVAWVGAIFIGVGVNFLTGTNGPLGLLLILAGAVFEVVAYLVRGRSRVSDERDEDGAPAPPAGAAPAKPAP